MNMILGPGFLAGAMLLFAWAYATFRRPDAERWTTNEFVAQSVTVGIAALLALGIGFTTTAIAFPEQAQFGILQLIGGVILLAVGVFACRQAFAKVRRLEAEASLRSESQSPPTPKPTGTVANQSRRIRKAA